MGMGKSIYTGGKKKSQKNLQRATAIYIATAIPLIRK